MSEPTYSEFEQGERQALLQVRSFITMHGVKEVDAYCAQRLHDILMDARHRESSQVPAKMESADEFYRGEQKRRRMKAIKEG